MSGLWTSVFAFGAFVGEFVQVRMALGRASRLYQQFYCHPADWRDVIRDPFNYVSGPTFGGVLYDAITFRWAIFLILIGEFISLVRLIRMTTEFSKFIH